MATRLWGGNYRIRATNCQIDGCSDQSRAGQQTQLAPQASPRERGCGRGYHRQGYSWLPQLPEQLDWSWTDHAQDHSTPTGHGTGATIGRNQGQSSQGTNARCEGTTNRRDPNSLQCFRCQGWGHMARECPTPATALNQSGGNQGNASPNPPPTTATTTNSRSPNIPSPTQNQN